MVKEKSKDPANFTVEDKLKKLYQLQTMLSEIDKIKTLRGELPLEVQDLEDEIEGLTTRIAKLESDMKELESEISERKGNMELNNMNIQRYKAQMDSVRNNREYDNLSKQIEYAELDNQLNEKKITEAKAKLEAKKDDRYNCNITINDRRADMDLKKSELEEIISENKVEEDKLREQSKNLEMSIEPRLLTAFKRIRKNSRNGLGIVYVQRDACGGCFNKIPPQRQVDIRMRKKIIVCEFCGRIMIDPELAGVEVAPKPEETKKKTRRASTRRKSEE